MAPQPTYDPPHVQLGRLMVEARRRGLTFGEWWEQAVRPGKAVVMTNSSSPPVGAVRWPSDRNDRITWQHAILGSKDGWRRAYNREPPLEREAALDILRPGLEALDEVAREREHDELRGSHTGIGAQHAVPSAA